MSEAAGALAMRDDFGRGDWASPGAIGVNPAFDSILALPDRFFVGFTMRCAAW